jgi:hypothetical protein
MNSKHVKTLKAIFTDPVSGVIKWVLIESLFIAVGCEIIEGKGSHVKVHKNGVIGYFVRPHPAKEAKRYQVRDVREFLTKIGVRP